jgi:hypothetical protein
MRFAGYESDGALSQGGFCRGVLRVGRDVAWRCDHEHDSRIGARACAYQAEGQARAAGLVPDAEQCRWSDPTTWDPGLARAARRGLQRSGSSV